MNKFKGFIKKEIFHILRDKRTLLILFGMPVAQILLFGFAITNEIKDVKIAILDNSKDVVTQEISNKILSSGYFQLYGNISSENQIQDEFKKGIIKEVIIFEPNFANNLNMDNSANVQIIADASDPNLANQIIAYTSSIILNYQNSYNITKPKPPLINTEIKMLYNPQLKSVFMFVPGIMAIILLLITAMMTSISITREKELGTMEVLLVSPLKPYQIVIGKVIPYLFLSLTITSIILLLAKFVFLMPIRGSIFLLAAECVLFVITALSLGILISTTAPNMQTAMMTSLGALMMPTIMLSGFIFPIDNLPLPLQILSNVIPAKWFLLIIRGIMLKGAGFEFLWVYTIILAGMTIFFISLSIKKFKVRLE